jgi:hypothetical protein
LANKQDLPMAKEPKELEKLLGLHELLSPISLSVSSGTLSSIENGVLPDKSIASSSSSSLAATKHSDHQLKTWHIQPTCAITGEGSFIWLLTMKYFLTILFTFKVFTKA